MKIITIAAALFATSALAQVTDEQIDAAYKACQSHVHMKQVTLAVVPGWDAGWEGCAKIEEAWRASAPAREQAKKKAQDDADRALVNDLAKKLGN